MQSASRNTAIGANATALPSGNTALMGRQHTWGEVIRSWVMYYVTLQPVRNALNDIVDGFFARYW